MWWAISTMTAVGYGDRFPISSEGRLLAVFLMATGAGVFATLSGMIAAWFLSPAAKEAAKDAESSRDEIKLLLMELKARLEPRGSAVRTEHPTEAQESEYPDRQ